MKRFVVLMMIGLAGLLACSDNDTPQATLAPAESATIRENDAPAWTADLLSEPLALDADADFSLTTTAGQPFTLSAQTDKITVLYFGFTTCPDICPLTLHELNRAYQSLEEPRDAVQIVLVTVDPDRDTPQVLADYVGRYHEDFLALTGDAAALQAAYDAFGVRAEPVPLPDSALGYTMDHTADVYIVPPDHRYSRTFAHGATFSNFAHDLALMIEQLGAAEGPQVVAYADQLHGVAQDIGTPLADFTLTSTQTAADFTLLEQRGMITVLYYGFTSCPDICPLTLYEISRALEVLGPLAAHVQVAMVTVDPDRDTPQLLKNYVERYDPRFIGLYGDSAATDAAKAVFGVLAFQQPLSGSALGYTIDHTADIFVVGPNGHYLLRIPHGRPYTQLADDLRVIIENEISENETEAGRAS